jgi:3-oxoacyl-(acyl-carrier-protein) synthase
MSSQLVRITGTGMITPAGTGIEKLWESCLNQRSLIENGLGSINDTDHNEIKSYIENSSLIKTPILKSRALDFALYSIATAMEEAGWSKLKSDDVIVIGTTTGMIKVWEDEVMKMTAGMSIDSNKVKYQSLSSLENQIKEAFNFCGKIITLSSACSASTQAFAYAYNLLSGGKATRCVAGGVEELGELTIKGFSSLKVLSGINCKPFDENRTGINLSEAAAFSCIEINTESKTAISLLAGTTILDSYHVTSPHPEGQGCQRSFQETLDLNKLSAKDIDLIHAHGTGSHHNDSSESLAIEAKFGLKVPVISTKGIHGHALAASGAVEISLCCKMIKEETILKNFMLETKDPDIKININEQTTQKKIKRIMKSTLGFGGVNSTIVIEAPND